MRSLAVTLDVYVIDPRRNVSIKGAAQLRIPGLSAVHRYLRHVKSFGRKIEPIEPEPRLARWDRRDRNSANGRVSRTSSERGYAEESREHQ